MFSFNNCASWLYILLSLGNRVHTFLGKRCKLCSPSVHFMVALLYLSVFPFGVGGLWIWLYQFLSSLIWILGQCGKNISENMQKGSEVKRLKLIVGGFICAFGLSQFISHFSSFCCLRKTAPRDCGIFWESSLIYLEFQWTLFNTSRYPYFDISDLQNWGNTNSIYII